MKSGDILGLILAAAGVYIAYEAYSASSASAASAGGGGGGATYYSAAPSGGSGGGGALTGGGSISIQSTNPNTVSQPLGIPPATSIGTLDSIEGQLNSALNSGANVVGIGNQAAILASGDTASLGGITITNVSPVTSTSYGNQAVVTATPSAAAATIQSGGIAVAGAQSGSLAAENLAALLGGQPLQG